MQKSESIIIILPLPPSVLSPNSTIGGIGGRFMKAAASKKYRRLAKEAVQSEEVSTAPWGACSVKAVFYHKQDRRRDPDNYTGSLKAAYDGVVDAGLVTDDDYKHMQREQPCFNIDKTNPRVELEIRRLT